MKAKITHQPAIWGFDSLHNRWRITGDLITRTGMRIGVGRDTDVAGHDLPVMRDAIGRPFIPGSSLKGVLRSSIEALLRGLSDEPEVQRTQLACLVLQSRERCITNEEMLEWRQPSGGQPALSAEEISENVLNHSCMVCQTFGSTWLASHVAIRDLPVKAEYWFGQFEVRTGVSLDRDTGTAGRGMLYSFETVPAGAYFELEIEADNLTDWQKGLLWLGLQPFTRGYGRLGGATSRGLGQVELTNLQWHGWESDNSAANVIKFLSDGLQPIELDTQKWSQALTKKLEEIIHA